jgi:DNA-binding MarR family transcriptional regulator
MQMPPVEATPEALQLLRALVGVLTHSARAIESATGVTNAQLFLLRQLDAGAPMSVGTLAQRMQARPNAVSAVLRRLVAARLVRQARSADDGRRSELSVTRRGRALIARAPASATQQIVDALATLRPHDRRALTRGLAALTSALDLRLDAAPLFLEPGFPDD